MLIVAKRIIKQIVNDKRSLAMILIVPLLLLTLLYLLLGKSDYMPVVVLENCPAEIASVLEEQKTIDTIEKKNLKNAEDFIKDGKADAVISFDEKGIHILMLEIDNVKTNAITDAVSEALKDMNQQGQMDIDFIYGDKDVSLFDSLAFLLLGVISFFLVFLFSGVSFVRERTSDTIERLMLTPVKASAVVGGYILGFGLFALIQSLLTLLYVKFVLRTPFAGQWWCAMLIMLLIAVIAVMLGVLVSAISKNEFQVMQFIPVIIIPQIFFSGLIPVDTLPYHLNILSYVMPLYYGCTGLKRVLVYGYGLSGVLFPILILCGFILLLFFANLAAVRKYRVV